MIRIKPVIEQNSVCPYCSVPMDNRDVLWHGIHVCVISVCGKCGSEITSDLKVGHAMSNPYQPDVKKGRLFGKDPALSWFGNPLLNSLRNPLSDHDVGFRVERIKRCTKAIILNCIDFLYGHTLLKLLNAESHLKGSLDAGLVVLVPGYLRWLVPDGVAEVWTVDMPLSKAQNYYPVLDRRIKRECERFYEVFVSSAHSHPKDFDITLFTRTSRHDFGSKRYRITFIWREDRPWLAENLILRAARGFNLMGLLLFWQNLKVRRLFSLLRKSFPDAVFTVAGLGKRTSFPAWIQDKRVGRFTEESEREACGGYSESRLVIGVHGSNMLLPSAHAGMTMDLMPESRWANFAQDVLYQEHDSRLSSFVYRYLPANIKVSLLNAILRAQVSGFLKYRRAMLDGLR